MKKIILVFNLIIIALQISAQRYTGYGRGVDWDYGGLGSGALDYFIPVVLLIILLVGGTLTLIDKIKDYLFPYKKGLVSFSEFKKRFTEFDIGAVVNNNTGDYFEICVFSKENYSTSYYIGISPYLIPPTYYEITKNEKLFYVRWDGKAYMLCSEKSEKRRFYDFDTSKQHQEEQKIQNILYKLNKDLDKEDYTTAIIPRTQNKTKRK